MSSQGKAVSCFFYASTPFLCLSRCLHLRLTLVARLTSLLSSCFLIPLFVSFGFWSAIVCVFNNSGTVYIIQLFLVLIVRGHTSNHLQCAQSFVRVANLGYCRFEIEMLGKPNIYRFFTILMHNWESEYTSRRRGFYFFNHKFYVPPYIDKENCTWMCLFFLLESIPRIRAHEKQDKNWKIVQDKE